jgi:hypothetical protein
VLDSLSGAILIDFCDWPPDDVTCASVDLEINYLDVQDYVCGVIDGQVCCAEFLELVALG